MLLFGDFSLQFFISFMLAAIIAFAYHEFAHAIVADRLGDPTPRSAGRITLNPLPHLDAFGLVMLAIAGFGWATTPVNPSMLRGNRRQAMALVAVAGPLMNLALAVLFGFLYRALGFFAVDGTVIDLIAGFFQLSVNLNLLLFAFNLIPLPPLDGFTILMGVLPAEIAYRLEPIRQYGTIILLGAIFLLPRLGFNLFGLVITPVLRNIGPILLGA